MANILARIFKRAASRDQSESVMASATVRPWELHDYSTKRQQYTAAQLVARFTGTVKVAASRNAMAVASTPIRVYRRGASSYKTRKATRKDFSTCGVYARKMADTGEDIEEITDPAHPLVALLSDSVARIEECQLWLGLTGDAYLWKGQSKPSCCLWSLAPQYTRPIPSPETFIGAYVYGRGTEIERTFPADQVVHIRNPNPMGDPYTGWGDLQSCIEQADLSTKISQFALAMIENGAQPGMVLSSEQWTSEEQIRKARAEFERMYAGPFKAGRTMFLGGKVTATPWSMSDKEVAFLSSSERVDLCIAACFDMPVAILRLETAALATAKEAMPQWQTMAIRPRCRRVEDAMNCQLVPDFETEGDRGNLFVGFDDPVQKEWLNNAQAVQGLYTAGILTQNEARAEIGHAPTEEGDEFYEPPIAAGQPGTGDGGAGSDSAGSGADGGDGEGGGGGDAEDPAAGKHGGHNVQHGAGRAPLRIDSAGIIAATSLMIATPGKACCVRPPRCDRHAFKDDKLTSLDFETALRQFFRGVTPRIVDKVGEAGLATELASNPEFVDGLAKVAERFMESVYQRGANQGILDLHGMADPVAMRRAVTEGAASFLEKFNGRLVRSVSDTVDGAIRSQLADGIQAGETIPELQTRVQDVMENVSNYGAERIARTETSRAMLASRETAWEASGIVKGKEWLPSSDACPLCKTLAERHNKAVIGSPFVKLGQTIQLIGGGTFTNDYAAMDSPPAHPDCNCSMAMILEGE